MSFKSKLSQLNLEVDTHAQLSKNRSVVDGYSKIANRLKKVADTLTVEANKKYLVEQLVQHGGVPVDPETGVFADVDNLLELLANYKASWEELKEKSLQEENNCLYQLEVGVKQKAKEFSEFHDLSWQEWVILKRKDFTVPELILENQRNVYKNEDLYKNYKLTLESFNREYDGFSFKLDQYNQINKLVEKLIELHGQMNTDNLPEAVQKFFNSVNNYKFSRPTLDLLTEEVFIWLKENNMLSKFMVTPNV
ncbi:hypothetical protein AB4251_25370 [Vibrio lentus]|uniref:Uncharacterized protein n=1 Tax=Vibrio lentus TaxID=136468 RepID=A0AB36XVH1_9VIBR|nr:hypothetical protein [Vibrio lentus]MCC4838549.1 hypothetical protein [Vibrio lentus]PMI16937.1 hypothetical protein BCU51_05965 [Vibrio lentus]PMK36536.1 hypothetical protein BCU02_10895 [Vibrio lentus]PMK50478.1 hypothetical protein BCT99_03390 [Vibrio lentus]PML27818.1 hypothetical protein BCT79_06730 [Vibrio lentus]